MEVLENTENDLQIDHRIIDCCVIALTHKVQNLRTCYTTKPVNTGMFMNFPWVSTLLTLMQTLKVQITAITPDASALQRFIPYLSAHQQCLAWRDDAQWLWATRYAWGRKPVGDSHAIDDLAAILSLSPEEIALCGPGRFDPLSVVSVRQPPIPPESHIFTIALGLAMGGTD